MKLTKNINTGDEELVVRTISTSPKEHFEGRWKSGRLYPLYSVVVNNGTTFVSQNAKMKEEPYVIYDAVKQEFKANDGWKIKEMSADSRLTALGGGSAGGGVTPEDVAEMISGKQDTIEDLSTIRSGASAGATAYQKPNSGIPASDIASGVIPTDVVKYSLQTLTDAQKAEARANIEAQDFLVSGTNIKTVNGESILGSGNIVAGDPNAVKYTEQTLTDAQKTQSRTNIGAGTYSKPSSGIPASDIASGVIPTVPTISTDISTDAASDAKTASPKAVKTYVDNGIAAVVSDLSDLADEVESIDIGVYEVAWDGNSEPVVANIPAGVTVTYNTTTYTGELAASASTKQKIYLVATGTTDNYDRYVTVGDSTYSWVNIGTTEITLADYATKSEVDQLEAKVGDNTDDITVLQNQMDNYRPIVIEGNVENAPDEEDITTDENDLLKFANRAAHTNYLGYVILRKGKTFASQVTVPNTIYEIRYNFVLDDDELVTIPSGCELRFNGGSISGGILNLNNALLSGEVNITSEPDMDETDEFVEGYKPRNLVLPVTWFGAKGDGLADDAPAIQRTIKWAHKNGATIVFDNGTYILGDGISDDATDTDKSKHTGYSYPADYPMLTNDWTGINDRQAFLEANPNDIGRNIVLDFFKFDNLRIEGNGATVKSHDNNGYVRNNAILRFWNCKGSSVLNLTVDANREGRMGIYQAPYWSDVTVGPSFVNSADLLAAKSLSAYLAQEVTWDTYGVTLPRGKFSGSRLVYSITLIDCSEVLFDGVNSVNGIVDGVAISSIDNKRILIKNGIFAHNQRHGIYLGVCTDVTVDSCKFNFAGIKLDDATPMYMSGNSGACGHIDCENGSYATKISRNCIITNSSFAESAKNGIILSRGFEDSKIMYCNFDGSTVYSYERRYCFNNEIAHNKFRNTGIANSFHQEGMNFHHNDIVVLVTDTTTKDLVNYSRNYSDSYVKGTCSDQDNYASIVPSRFCNNIFRVEYGADITSENRNTSCRFSVIDNIIVKDNVFWNFDFSDTGSGNFGVSGREFSGNKFLFDTSTYSWLSLIPNKTRSSGFSSRQDVKISNKQIRNINFDIERRSSETIIRIVQPYSASTRYLIIRDNLVGATIKMFNTGASANAPQLKREYYIHPGYSVNSSDKAIWMLDFFTKNSSRVGGLRTDFSGVFELDTNIALNGGYYFIEIHIPISPIEPLANELISFQSGQYAFSGTVVTETDISPMQDSVPTLANRNRGQFDGITIYDSGRGKLCVKNGTKFVDVNGFTPGKASGATADRPSATSTDIGLTFFDTDLGKMIVWNGTAWVNMDGTALS